MHRSLARTLMALLVIAGSFASATVVPVVANASGSPDFSRFGFANVIASVAVQPHVAATVGAGHVEVQIPAGFAEKPLELEILQGSNATFQASAPAGQKVVANFAFRVTDPATGQIITAFAKPVVAVVTDRAITDKSQYLNVTPTNPLRIEPNPVAPSITGDILKHGVTGAAVGWVVTTPTGMPSKLPSTGGGGMSTGVPLTARLLIGFAVLSVAGVVALTLRRSAA